MEKTKQQTWDAMRSPPKSERSCDNCIHTRGWTSCHFFLDRKCYNRSDVSDPDHLKSLSHWEWNGKDVDGNIIR